MSPVATPPDALAKLIKDELAKRTALHGSGAMVSLLIGVAATVFVAVVIAAVLRFIFASLGVSFLASFNLWMLVYFLIVVPVIVTQIRKGTPDFTVPHRGLDTDFNSVGGYQANQIQGAAIAVSALVNFGPRTIIDAGRGFVGSTGGLKATHKPIYDQAVRVILHLFPSPNALPLSQAIPPGMNKPEFEAVLKWLTHHQLADRSSDGKRVWLSTDCRTMLLPVMKAATSQG
jgi:hypothetical protein